MARDRDLSGAVVRVMVQLRSGQEAALREREIELALKEASSVTINKEVEYEARRNAEPSTTPARWQRQVDLAWKHVGEVVERQRRHDLPIRGGCGRGSAPSRA